jgi:putative PIN family toxin of toxin-antitoxin system
VVLDTQVFLRAAINRRSICGKIVFDLRDKYQLIFSEAMRQELEDVLSRSAIRIKFAQLTDEVVQTVLDVFHSADQITLPEGVEPISRDPKDDIFLICPATGKAQYLISEDKDLLVLNPYRGIAIINALEFLKLLQTDETQ